MLLVFGLLLSGCRPPQDRAASAIPEGMTGRLELQGEPVIGTVPVVVYLLDGTEGVTGASVSVTGDMTHAGMVPVIRAAAEAEPGLYVAHDFEFDMGGDWFVTAEVTLRNGEQFELAVPASVSSR